jgi:hypothetical protein
MEGLPDPSEDGEEGEVDTAEDGSLMRVKGMIEKGQGRDLTAGMRLGRASGYALVLTISAFLHENRHRSIGTCCSHHRGSTRSGDMTSPKFGPDP